LVEVRADDPRVRIEHHSLLAPQRLDNTLTPILLLTNSCNHPPIDFDELDPSAGC
jgi:hypothetical protein